MRLLKPLWARTLVLLFGIVLELSAASQYKILSDCDESSEVRGLIAKDAQIKVHFAVASAFTCYSVTATADGKPVHGYVINRELDGVRAFEKAGMEARRNLIEAPPLPPPSASQTEDPALSSTDKIKPVETPEPPKQIRKPKIDVQPH